MLEVPLRNSNEIARPNDDGWSERIFLPDCFSRMSDENGRPAGAVGQAPPNGNGTEHVKIAPIGKFPWMLDLAHEVEGPKRDDVDRYLRILQITAFIFRRDLALQFPFRAPGCPDCSGKRNRHVTRWIDVIDPIEGVFAIDRYLYSVTGLDP